MRKEQVNEVLEQLPAQVAKFDDAGIRAAIMQLQNTGLLHIFLDAVRTDVIVAAQVLQLVWMLDSPVSAALSNKSKVSTAYAATVSLLPPNATTDQVVSAFIAFLGKLLH